MNLRTVHLLCLAGLLPLLGCDPENMYGSPNELQGTWYLWSIDSISIHGRSVPLTFDGSAHLTGSDMCHTFSGEYQATGTTLRITGLETTTENCIDSAYPGLDSRIQLALSGTVSWVGRDSSLDLVGSTGHSTLRYGRNLPPAVP